jgi:DNA-binding IclR family transcriptional regulator
VTGLDDFFAELETARTRGIALDVEEGEEGLCCVAARIRVPAGRPAAAVAVAVGPDRLRAERERLVSLVVSAARRSSALLFGAREGSGAGRFPSI